MRFNNTTLVGRITKDAELRFTQAGKPILNIRLGFDQGSKEERSSGYIDVVMFGERGEKIVSWCHKGREILVSGRLQYREWGEGQARRSALEIVAFDLEFTKPAESDGQQAGAPDQQRRVDGQPINAPPASRPATW